MLKRILAQAGVDTFKYFPVRLVPALTSIVTVPVFTRLISREDYGYFALISSAVALIAVVATQWINGSIVRLYWTYEKEERGDEYVATAVWSTMGTLALVSLLAAGGVWLFRDAFEPGLMALAPLGVASLAANHTATTILQILRAGNRSTRYAQLSIASTLIGTTFSIWFVAGLDQGAAGILAGVIVGRLAVLPFGLGSARAQGRLSPRFVRRDILTEFMRYGFPFVPAALASWILVLADRYIIEFLRGSAEVGLYSVSYGLGERIMQLVTLPFLVAAAPVLVQTFEKQGEELTQRVQTQLTRYFAVATFPLLAGMAAVSKHFVEFFTGELYHEAYPVLPIVAAGAMLYGLVQIAGNGITLHRRSAIIMTNTLAAAAFNIVANLLLVDRFGYVAAGVTTVASYALLLLITAVRGRRFMSWKPPWAELARVAAASAVMAAVIVLAFWRLPSTAGVLALEATTGVVVYVATLALMKGFRADEVEFAKEAGGKLLAKLGLRRD